MKAFSLLLTFGISVFSYTNQVKAQSVPETPLDVDFAGVTIHLNEQNRALLQREVGRLYANRAELQRDIESLRQLTPLLEPILTAQQLPVDYRYAVLPFGGDSPTGYWGLTPQRATALHLLMNVAVDERYHPLLATQTVTTYLNRLCHVSDNPVSALVQYLQADTLASRTTAVATKVSYVLPSAQSPALMWSIIARKLAFEREEPLLRLPRTYLVYEHNNAAGYSLPAVSRQLGLEEARLQPFNAWLKAGTIPLNKNYPVLIRVTADEFPAISNRNGGRQKQTSATLPDVGFPILRKLPQSSVSTHKNAVFYTINGLPGVQAQPCDNIITLAHYGKIKIRTLLSYNELSDRDVVQPGQIYYLARKFRRAKIPFHVVQKNQTVREVANTYGVRMKSLLRFNRILSTQRVQTGRILWMRKKRPNNKLVEYSKLPTNDPKPATDEGIPQSPPAPADSVRLVLPPEPAIAGPTKDSLAHRKADSLLLKPVPVVAATADTKQVATPPAPDSTAKVVLKKNPPTESPDALNMMRETLKLHAVKPGQTYYSISKQYGIPLKQLYAWNNLSEDMPLEIGQELIVDLRKQRPSALPKQVVVAAKMPKSDITNKPAPLTKPVSTAAPAPVKMPERFLYHIVRPGQTVYRVALINRVTVPDLMRWNNLKSFTIEVGQQLLIRKGK